VGRPSLSPASAERRRLSAAARTLAAAANVVEDAESEQRKSVERMRGRGEQGPDGQHSGVDGGAPGHLRRPPYAEACGHTGAGTADTASTAPTEGAPQWQEEERDSGEVQGGHQLAGAVAQQVRSAMRDQYVRSNTPAFVARALHAQHIRSCTPQSITTALARQLQTSQGAIAENSGETSDGAATLHGAARTGRSGSDGFQERLEAYQGRVLETMRGVS